MSRTVFLCLGLLSLTLPTGCGNERQQDSAAYDRLEQAVERGGRIDMRSVTSYPWDRMVSIKPYSTRGAVNDALGFEWDAGDALPANADHEHLLIFARGDQVVGFVEDFDGANPRRCLPRELRASQAILEVHLGRSARRVRVLAPATPEGRACAREALVGS